MKDLSDFREDYRKGELLEGTVNGNPFKQFEQWLQEAIDFGLGEPNAMSVATVSADGKPSVRVVLLKELNSEGFVFYTNYNSRKGRELAQNPNVALVFDWYPMERQVRVEGVALKMPDDVSADYFDSRPEGSKIGAWVSPQSEVIENREALDRLQSETETRFEGQPIPKPPHWGGFIIVPEVIEFWQGRTGRLHDRLVYYRSDDNWDLKRLAP